MRIGTLSRLAPPLLAISLFASPCGAQYLYLDANGDGVRTSADVLSSTGPTTVGVWLRVDANREGAPVVCSQPEYPLTIMSYEFILHASQGTVAYGSFEDRMGWEIEFGTVSSDTDFYAGRCCGTSPTAGPHHLASLTVTPLSGIPQLEIATFTPIVATGFTAFGSECPGVDLDNTLKLGSDWFDADGLGSEGASSFWPQISPLAAMTVLEGESVTQEFQATDADGDTVGISKSVGPPFMAVSVISQAPGVSTGAISLTPFFTHAGYYEGGVQVTDGILISERRFAITVRNVPHVDLTPVPDVVMEQHGDSLIFLHATNPDGRIGLTLDSAPSYVTFYQDGDHIENFALRISPNLASEVGTASVTYSAFTTEISRSDTFLVTVLPNPLPPAILVQPDEMHVLEEGRVLVQVADPDFDPIVSLTLDDSAIPASDARSFTTSNGNRNGLLLWTPETMGTYPLRFTATDTSGAVTTREFGVVVNGRRPVVSAPATVYAVPLIPVTISVSATSPDGVPLTSLALDPTPVTSLGATFVADPTFQTGTLTWTPPVTGTPVEGCLDYTLTFRASDGVVAGTATTRVEVSLADSDTLETSAFRLLVSNAGQTAFESRNVRGGLFYPPSSPTSLLFGMGPWIGGTLGPATQSPLRVSRGGGDTEFAPGAIAGDRYELFEPRFRNYRLERGDVLSPDYLAWPAADGAPVTESGTPRIEGKSLLWSLSHDLSLLPRVTVFEYWTPSQPVGVELRQTTFVYGGTGPIANVAIVRYRMTNRSPATIESTYVGAFADPDIGSPADDLVGYDREREMGYVYNSSALDSVFGATPPALGVVWLGGTGPDGGAVPCGAFQTYSAPDLATYPLTALRSYLYLQGKDAAGGALHVSGEPAAPVTTYRFDGDPVAGSGWLDDSPQDKRIILGSGPVTLEPGETVEFATALVVGQGSDRLASVAELRRLAGMTHYLASTGFEPAPYVDLPPELELADGQPFQLRVSAFDPEGHPLVSLTADLSALPAGQGAEFLADPDLAGGTFSWTPQLGHAESFTIRLTAATDRSSTFETTLRVGGPNQAPLADAGGPYAGVRGIPLGMSSAASSDPDNDDLTTAWNFGDGASAAGGTISHAYASAGTFAVIATVSDGFASATDTTAAVVQETGSASAWESSGVSVLRLASPRDAWCFQLEPVGSSFPLDAIARPIRLVWRGGNEPREIVERERGEPPALEDRDGDGIPEECVCFAGSEFRTLFADLPAGTSDRLLTLEGSLTVGGGFAALLSLRVTVPGALDAVVAPNPLNPGGNLTVRTTRPGRARITIHDVHGRAIRTVHDGFLPAGLHDFVLDGRNTTGVRLGSGVYFYRIVAGEGSSAGRFTILK